MPNTFCFMIHMVHYASPLFNQFSTAVVAYECTYFCWNRRIFCQLCCDWSKWFFISPSNFQRTLVIFEQITAKSFHFESSKIFSTESSNWCSSVKISKVLKGATPAPIWSRESPLYSNCQLFPPFIALWQMKPTLSSWAIVYCCAFCNKTPRCAKSIQCFIATGAVRCGWAEWRWLFRRRACESSLCDGRWRHKLPEDPII